MNITAGSSGSTIDKLTNGYLRKKDTSDKQKLLHQYAWMQYFSGYGITPAVRNLIFNADSISYDVEYIESDVFSFDDIKRSLFDIIDFISKQKLNSAVSFETYIDRINKHFNFCQNYIPLFNDLYKSEIILNGRALKSFNIINSIKLLHNNLKCFNSFSSTCHGDLTLENVLVGDNIYLIDSLYLPDVWSSYLIDYSKLLQSVHFGYETIFNNVDLLSIDFIDNTVLVSYEFTIQTIDQLRHSFRHLTDEEFRLALILELTQYIRMFKYKINISEKSFVLAYIISNILYEELI